MNLDLFEFLMLGEHGATHALVLKISGRQTGSAEMTLHQTKVGLKYVSCHQTTDQLHPRNVPVLISSGTVCVLWTTLLPFPSEDTSTVYVCLRPSSVHESSETLISFASFTSSLFIPAIINQTQHIWPDVNSATNGINFIYSGTNEE